VAQSPITRSTRSTLACIELAEMLRAGLSLSTSHLSPVTLLPLPNGPNIDKPEARIQHTRKNVAC
jgi:hypothetical protein